MGAFFEQLGIPLPDFNFNAGGGTQAEQAAKIMINYEKILQEELIDYCIVVGDVTSTMACSIVAKKMGIKVIHVEGGIRSFDFNMPEEINRIVMIVLQIIFSQHLKLQIKILRKLEF